MKVITTVHYNRPTYTAQVLAALRACPGIEDYTLLARLEPGCPEVIDQFDAIDWMPTEIQVNPEVEGCNRNTHTALAWGFERAEQVIHVEDDIVLTPDALAYFEWALTRYRIDPSVRAIVAWVCSTEASRPFRCYRASWFNPWGWATWRDRWEAMQPGWVTAPDKIRSWDDGIHVWITQTDGRSIFPCLSRCQNIGAVDGIHVPNAVWHAQHHHVPLTAAQVELPDENWAEIPNPSGSHNQGTHVCR
jgi:hypothetical protein